MELDELLSKSDALKLLEIVYKSISIRKEEEYLDLMEEVKKVVNFQYSMNGFTEIRNILHDKKVSNSYHINGGHPTEYLEIYFNNGIHTKDIALLEFYKTFEIQNFKDLYPRYNEDPNNPLLALSQDFGINDCFIYGVRDSNFTRSTVFVLSSPYQMDNTPRTRAIIKFLVPSLSVALKHLCPAALDENIPPLTPRESEILKWLVEGKSTWEISKILIRSERVVEFHIKNILKKLNAMNRTHAVAIALKNHLVSF